MKLPQIGTLFVLSAALIQATVTAPVLAQPNPSSSEKTHEEFSTEFRVSALNGCLEQQIGDYTPQAYAYCLCIVEEITNDYSETHLNSPEWQESEEFRTFSIEVRERCIDRTDEMFFGNFKPVDVFWREL